MLNFKQNKKTGNIVAHLGSLLFVVILLLLTPTLSVCAQTGDDLPRYGAAQKVYAGAIEKVGFYLNISRDRVTIVDMKSYRKRSYLVADDMIITKQAQNNNMSESPRLEINQGNIFIHSIVKLIVVDAEVVEIILIQESS